MTSSLKSSNDCRVPAISRLVGSWFAQLARKPAVAVEIDDAAQIVGVGHVLLRRVGLDEAVDRRQRLVVLAVLVLGERSSICDCSVYGPNGKRAIRRW